MTKIFTTTKSDRPLAKYCGTQARQGRLASNKVYQLCSSQSRSDSHPGQTSYKITKSVLTMVSPISIFAVVFAMEFTRQLIIVNLGTDNQNRQTEEFNCTFLEEACNMNELCTEYEEQCTGTDPVPEVNVTEVCTVFGCFNPQILPLIIGTILITTSAIALVGPFAAGAGTGLLLFGRSLIDKLRSRS